MVRNDKTSISVRTSLRIVHLRAPPQISHFATSTREASDLEINCQTSFFIGPRTCRISPCRLVQLD
jgi:hypothetical protein